MHGVNVTIETHIDIPKNLAKINNDTFWKFAANEWWRLMTPFVPMDTGTLSETVRIKPKIVEYHVPYAHRQYEGDFDFRTDKHQKASRHWDEAAIPTEKQKLIDAMQDYVDSGRLNLDG